MTPWHTASASSSQTDSLPHIRSTDRICSQPHFRDPALHPNLDGEPPPRRPQSPPPDPAGFASGPWLWTLQVRSRETGEYKNSSNVLFPGDNARPRTGDVTCTNSKICYHWCWFRFHFYKISGARKGRAPKKNKKKTPPLQLFMASAFISRWDAPLTRLPAASHEGRRQRPTANQPLARFPLVGLGHLPSNAGVSAAGMANFATKIFGGSKTHACVPNKRGIKNRR